MASANVTGVPVKRTPAWKVALNLAILALLIAVFVWQIHKDWKDIATYNWHVSWPLIGAALVVLLACSALDILIWSITLGWFTDPLPYRQAAPVYIWSYIARYLPGKVGSLILRVALTTELGCPPVAVLASSVVELALRTASALFVFLVPMLLWGLTLPHSGWLAKAGQFAPHIFIVLIVLALICAHPRIMLPITNAALKALKKSPIERKPRYRDILTLFLLLLLRWLGYGLAFVALACALNPQASQYFAVLLGTAAGSWAIGFIASTPGGLGMTELTIQQILVSLHFDKSVADILPLLLRFTTLIGEGIWALIAVVLWRSRPAVVSIDTATLDRAVSS